MIKSMFGFGIIYGHKDKVLVLI